MNFKKRVNGSWTDTPHYIHKTDTDIITTLPAVLYPNDTTATVGLKGQTLQSSVTSPDSPVMPQGTGERTGNLYNINAKDVNNGYVNNMQLNQDGTTSTWRSAEISEYIPINGDTAYTFNGIGSYNSPCYGLYDENKQLIGAYRYNGVTIIKFTSPNNARYFRFTHIKTFVRAMMVEGTYTTSTMPEFEPYGVKIPISSAGQTNNIYLGEVQSTRRIKKLVFDGTGDWVQAVAGVKVYRINVSDYLREVINIPICTHYKGIAPVNGSGALEDLETAFLISTSGNNFYYIRDDRFNNANDFKSYLAAQYSNGTPVTIWYVLATEETAVVNEPLMKIGTYADTLSSISIPVTAGGDTLSVGTTVRPSEVTVNYKGWHPVADVHEFIGNYPIGTMQTLPISELETHTISELQGGEWS